MGSNVHGYRATAGVIIPSTNTVVENDYEAMKLPGFSYHYGRMYIAEPNLSSDEDFVGLLGQIRESINVAVRDVMTVKPDYLVMGMSAETFWGGVEGNAAFEKRISDLAGGIPVATGASACRAALEAMGVKSISVVSPYQPIADTNVRQYFEEAGFTVNVVKGLRCPSATAIAEVTEQEMVEVLREIDHPDSEALVQVGTNLSMVNLATEAEKWMGKPVVAINTATMWHSMRMNGFTDQMTGFGRLLEEF